MVSKYSLLYSVYSDEGLTVAELVKKLGGKQDKYRLFYAHLKDLEANDFVQFKDKRCFLVDSDKTRKLLRLIDFCVGNKIDYDGLFLPKTIGFVEIGLKQGFLKDMPFDRKTIARISLLLSRHGFLIIGSEKPYSAHLVHSKFLEDLVEFFRGKVEVGCKPLFEDIDEKNLNIMIEREFSKYKRRRKNKFELEGEIQFIHRSLSLEGNTLTLPETERLIMKNIPARSKPFREMQEVIDYKRALDELIADVDSLDLDSVLRFHATAMNSMKAGAGQIRKQNVKIKGNPDFKIPGWKLVPKLLEEFFDSYYKWFNEKMSAHKIVEFAAFLHMQFQRIHPFVDGNSRTSRAIFIHTLLKKGFPLITFPVGFTDQYMALTKLSKKRDDEKFFLSMKQIVLHSLKQTNKNPEFHNIF